MWKFCEIQMSVSLSKNSLGAQPQPFITYCLWLLSLYSEWQLSGYSRDHTAHQAQSIYSYYRTSWLAPGVMSFLVDETKPYSAKCDSRIP